MGTTSGLRPVRVTLCPVTGRPASFSRRRHTSRHGRYLMRAYASFDFCLTISAPGWEGRGGCSMSSRAFPEGSEQSRNAREVGIRADLSERLRRRAHDVAQGRQRIEASRG